MKIKSKRVVSGVMVLFLTLSIFALSGCDLFSRIFGSNLAPDWEQAAIVRERAINAQYLPSSENLVGTPAQPLQINLSNDTTSSGTHSMTIEEYNRLIDDIGSIWHPFQGDFNIHDVRDIVVYLSEYIGVFDNWFRYRGTNWNWTHPDEIAHVPRALADGEFFMTINEETSRITILQRTGFQPWVWNREAGHGVWNGSFPENYRAPSHISGRYSANWPIMSDVVLALNYYYIEIDGERIEVVEAEIIEFFNVYNEVYIVGRQHLRNIRDRSFTRSVIQTASSGLDHDAFRDFDWSDFTGNETTLPFGTDIAGAQSNGISRSFIHIDYSDSSNVSVLLSSQIMATRYNGIVDTGWIQHLNLADGELNVFHSHFAFGDNYIAWPNAHRHIFGQNATTSLTGDYSNAFLDPNYSTRSGQNIEFIHSRQDGATNNVGHAVVSMMTALRITNQTINLFNPNQTEDGVLEQAIWDIFDSISAELTQNSFLARNYQSGLSIRYADAPDITNQLRNPPDWTQVYN